MVIKVMVFLMNVDDQTAQSFVFHLPLLIIVFLQRLAAVVAFILHCFTVLFVG